MKRKSQRRGAETLEQFKVAVQKFVETKTARVPISDGAPSQHSSLGARRMKSRKEMRKEKRLQKKSRMRDYYQRKHLTRGDSGVEVAAAEEGTVQSQDDTGPGTLEEARKEEKAPPPAARISKKKAKYNQIRRKALLEDNEKEDRVIKSLSKALGFNRRKNKNIIPQIFVRDGLDYILSIVEPGAADLSGLYESDDDTNPVEEELMNQETDRGPNQTLESSREDPDSGQESDCAMEVEESHNKEQDDKEESSQLDQPACGNAGDQTSNENNVSRKYVPPQLREMAETMDAKKKEELVKLKKNVKGLLNRLSAPNMVSISSQLEEFYMTNSRKDMNDTLTDALLEACVTPTLMPDRLMMEHVLLISILHHNIGIEVGGHILGVVVKQFDEHSRSISETKECDNLINLIAHFYNFHVIHCMLVFDILKKLTSNFKEKDIALILLLLKQVGFTLRKDDAAALRDFIMEAQNKANSVAKQFQDQTRIHFMLEIMLALKNNDMRKIPGYDPEPVEKLRKLQRSLIRNNHGEFLLHASLENLLRTDQIGRWWIVGSSLGDTPMNVDTNAKTQQNVAVGKISGKIMELARKQRMNTDIRRNIFCVIMTSEDYLDAFEKLLRLGLNNQQEREIIHVLIHCCLQEKVFNPFYAFLVEKFCASERRFQMTFQFSMWDRFRELKNMTNLATTNLVHLLVHLLSRQVVSLSIFKVIEFSELDKPKVMFLRQILHKLLMDTEPEDLMSIFRRISGIPKLALLREGLKLFIRHFLLKNASSLGTSENASLLKEHVEIIEKALQTKDTILKF